MSDIRNKTLQRGRHCRDGNAYRALQVESDDIGDVANDDANQIVDKVEWSIGI